MLVETVTDIESSAVRGWTGTDSRPLTCKSPEEVSNNVAEMTRFREELQRILKKSFDEFGGQILAEIRKELRTGAGYPHHPHLVVPHSVPEKSPVAGAHGARRRASSEHAGQESRKATHRR